jgi:hypothetical protein
MVFAQALLPSPFRLWTCAERYLEKTPSNAVPNASGCMYKIFLCVVVVSFSFTRPATFDRGRYSAVIVRRACIGYIVPSKKASHSRCRETFASVLQARGIRPPTAAEPANCF